MVCNLLLVEFASQKTKVLDFLFPVVYLTSSIKIPIQYYFLESNLQARI